MLLFLLNEKYYWKKAKNFYRKKDKFLIKNHISRTLFVVNFPIFTIIYRIVFIGKFIAKNLAALQPSLKFCRLTLDFSFLARKFATKINCLLKAKAL